MAGMKFEYDESGAKFVYFIISFYAMIIIPATYYFWPRKEIKKAEHAEDLSCFEPCRLKNQLLNKNEPQKKRFRKIITIVLVIGWLIFLVLAYKASQIEIEHKEYDPFAILGIDREATDGEIKKRYRELSRVMHPDKGGSEEKFKELAKAYQALTDEETKKNWIEYGNPDGPGVTQFGIALPKWIVDGKNSYLVLGVYALIFMIIMPVIVGTWWYRSIKYTGDQVLISTSQLYNYLVMKNPQMHIKKAIMILGSSREFERYSNPEIEERPSDNIEVPQLIKDLPDLAEKTRELPYSAPYSRKARALIHAHLNRMPLPPNTLMKDKNVIIGKCPFLIHELVNTTWGLVSAVHANYLPKNFQAPKLETIEYIMKLSPMIVQALWNKSKSNLLQLPHLDESHLRHFVTKKRNINNIKQFVTMNDSDRRSILRHLTDEQYEDIMRVCHYYPLIEMDVKIQVIDDEDEQTITVGAVVTLVINLERKSLGLLIGKDTVGGDLKFSNMLDLDNNQNENTQNEDEEAANKPANSNKQSTHKPWEKQQKKKPKSAKSKSKAVAAKLKSKKATEASKAATTKADEKENGGDLEASADGSNKNENDGDDEDAGGKVEDVLDENNSDRSEHSDVSDNEEGSNFSKNNGNIKNSSNNNNNNNKTVSNRANDKKLNSSNSSPSVESDEYFEKFQEMQKKKEKLETKKKISHRVYCPYFPQIKQECWWLYVADKKQNSIICSPTYICTLKDTEEFELKFVAPKQPGNYTYSVVLRSDSYLDFDVINQIKIEVLPAAKIEDHPQWNFTDEETAKNGDEEAVDDEFTTESESDS